MLRLVGQVGMLLDRQWLISTSGRFTKTRGHEIALKSSAHREEEAVLICSIRGGAARFEGVRGSQRFNRACRAAGQWLT